VLSLAHAKLAAHDDLPEQDRAHHKAEALRWYERADKKIKGSWQERPGDDMGKAIWDFRTEARELMHLKDSKE
jgi:hypothetical protein